MPPQFPQIHILSLGAISKLLTHSLLNAHPSLPICLILRPTHPALQPSTQNAFTVSIDGKPLPPAARRRLTVSTAAGLADRSIRHLILPTKAYAALPAIRELRGKFDDQSGADILGAQNGLGTLESLCEVFPDGDKYAILGGIITHGVYSTSPFDAVHAGKADMLVGYARPPPASSPPASSPPVSSSSPPPPPPPPATTTALHPRPSLLADLITSTPLLNATFEPSLHKILLSRLRKLCANAVLNPLTALINMRNGTIFSPAVHPLLLPAMTALTAETSAVLTEILKSSYPASPPSTEAAPPPDAWLRSALSSLSVPALEAHVRAVGLANAKNYSSMCVDVRARRPTEIDAINGAVVRAGRALGVPTPVNARVVAAVGARERGGPEVRVDEVGRCLLSLDDDS